MSIHMTGTEDAVVVRTAPWWMEAYNALHVAVTCRETVIFWGLAGTGKTASSEVLAPEVLADTAEAFPTAAPRRRVSFPVPLSRSSKGFYQEWWKAITGAKEAKGTEASLRDDIIDLLSEGNVLCELDEAHHLGYDGLEQYRFVWDKVRSADGTRHFPGLLIGEGELWQIVRSSRTLKSRTARNVHFRGIPRGQLHQTLAEYHPLFAGAHPDVITMISSRFAHHNWRHWARVLQAAKRAAPGLGHTGPIDQVLATHILRELR